MALTPDCNWRPIPGYEDAYAINAAGDVLSVGRTVTHRATQSPRRNSYTRRVTPRVLVPMTHRASGLQIVTLCDHGVRRRHYVHLLLAAVWGGDP